LNDCISNQSFQAFGGNPDPVNGYSTAVNGNSIQFSKAVNGGQSTYLVRRLSGAAPPTGVQQSLTISDGNLVTTVPVNFANAAAGICP
jgi:hypothetical protein